MGGSARALLRASLGAVLPLVMPVGLVAGIVMGVATPTEVSAFAVLYGLALAMFGYRAMSPAAFPPHRHRYRDDDRHGAVHSGRRRSGSPGR